MFELDDKRRDELIETWAHKLVDRGLGTAAVFLLEAHKPISGVGAQAALAFKPLLNPLVPFNMGELAAFMHSINNIELLERRIEQLESERHDRLEAERRRRAEVRRRARRIARLRRKKSNESGR